MAASFSAAPAAGAKLQIKSGSTVLVDVHVGTTPVVLHFGDEGLQSLTDNVAMTAVLDSGAGAVVGKVNIVGFVE